MSRLIASLVCGIFMIGLFWLDRENKPRPSAALWIPVAWFLVACSRPVSRWFTSVSGDIRTMTAQVSDGSPMDRAVLTGLLFLGLIVLLNRRRRVTECLSESIPILLFFGYCLVSLMWSDYPGVGFKRWNKAVGDWVMILIIWTEAHPVHSLKRVLARTTYTLIPLSILFMKYFPEFGRTYGRWMGEVHYCGVTTDKNALGAICLLFGIAAVWRMLGLFGEERGKGRNNQRLMVQCVIIALILWLFSMLDSVTSLSCFLLAAGVLFAIRFRIVSRNPMMIHGVVLVTLMVPVTVTLLGASPELLHAMGRNSTLTERTDIWQMVIRLTPNRWIGTGYESFWLGPRLDTMVANVTHWWVPNQSHNGYLEIYANLGWVGVGCLAVVLLWGYRKVIRALRQNLPASNLMLAYFLAGLIFNLTEAAFFRMMIPSWMFLLLAITQSRPKQPPTGLARPRLWAASSSVPVNEL